MRFPEAPYLQSNPDNTPNSTCDHILRTPNHDISGSCETLKPCQQRAKSRLIRPLARVPSLAVPVDFLGDSDVIYARRRLSLALLHFHKLPAVLLVKLLVERRDGNSQPALRFEPPAQHQLLDGRVHDLWFAFGFELYKSMTAKSVSDDAEATING
jgi:hypothetical protein